LLSVWLLYVSLTIWLAGRRSGCLSVYFAVAVAVADRLSRCGPRAAVCFLAVMQVQTEDEAKVLECLVRFLYTGDISEAHTANEDAIAALLMMADRLGIECAVHKCAGLMVQRLSLDSCTRWLEMADTLTLGEALKDVVRTSRDYIAAQFKVSRPALCLLCSWPCMSSWRTCVSVAVVAFCDSVLKDFEALWDSDKFLTLKLPAVSAVIGRYTLSAIVHLNVSASLDGLVVWFALVTVARSEPNVPV